MGANITIQQMLIFFVAFQFCFDLFDLLSKRNKMFATFRRVNKQRISKWVKLDDDFIIFDGKKYDVVPDCLCPQFYSPGLFKMFGLGIWIMSADYSWYRSAPHDPNAWGATVISPAVRKVINNADRMRAFARGIQAQTGAKKSGLAGYLPYIAVGIVLLVAVWVYNNNQVLAANQTALASHLATLENLVKNMGK
jgi:hypothetical protein